MGKGKRRLNSNPILYSVGTSTPDFLFLFLYKKKGDTLSFFAAFLFLNMSPISILY